MTYARARALYRALLTLAPRGVRGPHPDEMEEVCLDAFEAARRSGTGAVAAAWLRAITDLVVARASDPFRRRRRSRIPDERKTIMVRGSSG